MISNVINGPTPNSSITKPSYTLNPGYIWGTASVDIEDEEKNIFTLMAIALNKEIWGSLEEPQKKQVIDEHRFIYIKVNEKSEIVEIGMHVNKCKSIEELGIKRLMIGKGLMNKDISIVAMPSSSYTNMIKRLVPSLTN